MVAADAVSMTWPHDMAAWQRAWRDAVYLSCNVVLSLSEVTFCECPVISCLDIAYISIDILALYIVLATQTIRGITYAVTCLQFRLRRGLQAE